MAIIDLGAVHPWPSRLDPFAGMGALTFPLPTKYDAARGFAVGARPLPAPRAKFGAVVRRWDSVTSRTQAVNYARAGYAASRKAATSDTKNREAWQRVAQLYAFVHDLDFWIQSGKDVPTDEATRDKYVTDLRGKLRFADAESDKLRKATKPTAAPGPTVQVPGPVMPAPEEIAPVEGSIFATLFQGKVFGIPKPVAMGVGLLLLFRAARTR